eukprot:403368738
MGCCHSKKQPGQNLQARKIDNKNIQAKQKVNGENQLERDQAQNKNPVENLNQNQNQQNQPDEVEEEPMTIMHPPEPKPQKVEQKVEVKPKQENQKEVKNMNSGASPKVQQNEILRHHRNSELKRKEQQSQLLIDNGVKAQIEKRKKTEAIQKKNRKQDIVDPDDVQIDIQNDKENAMALKYSESPRQKPSKQKSINQANGRKNIFNKPKQKSSHKKLDDDLIDQNQQNEMNDFNDLQLLSSQPMFITQTENIFTLIKNLPSRSEDRQLQTLKDYQEIEQYSIQIDQYSLNPLTFAINNGKVQLVQELFEFKEINQALTLQIYQTSLVESLNTFERHKLDHFFTLKVALNTKDKVMFENVLKHGYYDHLYRMILIKSEYFKLWFSKRVAHHNTINDLEDLLHSLGMDAEDSLILTVDEKGIRSLKAVEGEQLPGDSVEIIKILNSIYKDFCYKCNSQLEAQNFKSIFEIIKQNSEQDLFENQDPTFNAILNFDLQNFTIQKDWFDENEREQLGDRNQIGLITYLILSDKLSLLEKLIKQSRSNIYQLLNINEGTTTTMNPYYRLFSLIIQNNLQGAFILFYENPEISNKIIDEDVVMIILEQIIEFSVTNTDLLKYLEMVLNSQTTMKVFKSLQFEERFTYIEQLLIIRGKLIESLIDHIRQNVDEELQEECFLEQSQSIVLVFKQVYNLLSQQPYSLYMSIKRQYKS